MAGAVCVPRPSSTTPASNPTHVSRAGLLACARCCTAPRSCYGAKIVTNESRKSLNFSVRHDRTEWLVAALHIDGNKTRHRRVPGYSATARAKTQQSCVGNVHAQRVASATTRRSETGSRPHVVLGGDLDLNSDNAIAVMTDQHGLPDSIHVSGTKRGGGICNHSRPHCRWQKTKCMLPSGQWQLAVADTRPLHDEGPKRHRGLHRLLLQGQGGGLRGSWPFVSRAGFAERRRCAWRRRRQRQRLRKQPRQPRRNPRWAYDSADRLCS